MHTYLLSKSMLELPKEEYIVSEGINDKYFCLPDIRQLKEERGYF